VAAVANPVSVVSTFLFLSLFGRSLKVISLAGMAFAVGMLVDNTVVMLENIVTKWTAGADARAAAVRGAGEVWGAVLASTLTTVAVFLPVLFVQEEAGQLFGDIALAISGAVARSLVVSVLVVPTAAAWLLAGRGPGGSSARPSGDAATRAGGRLTAGLLEVLRWLLAGPWRQLAGEKAIVAAAVWATWMLLPKVEYLPEGNRNLVFGIMLPPPGYNLDEMLRMREVVEQRLLPNWDVEPGSVEAKRT
jgi:Cation/multidrug efflux pump